MAYTLWLIIIIIIIVIIIIIIKFIEGELLARGSVFMMKDPAVYQPKLRPPPPHWL